MIKGPALFDTNILIDLFSGRVEANRFWRLIRHRMRLASSRGWK
jgi:predicted nucleic acid-binding protein